MVEETQALVRQLVLAVGRRDGVHLTPQGVQLALSALQIYVNGSGTVETDEANELIQLALLDGEGGADRILAAIKDGAVARAALQTAKRQYPGRRLKLRGGRPSDDRRRSSADSPSRNHSPS